MKKIWILLSFVFIFGGSVSAQLPIILESELKRLQAEAASGKSKSESSFRKRTTRVATEDEQQPVEETQSAATEPTNTNTAKTTASKTNVKANTQTTSDAAAEDKSGSDALKKFRERQKRLKNSR